MGYNIIVPQSHTHEGDIEVTCKLRRNVCIIYIYILFVLKWVVLCPMHQVDTNTCRDICFHGGDGCMLKAICQYIRLSVKLCGARVRTRKETRCNELIVLLIDCTWHFGGGGV